LRRLRHVLFVIYVVACAFAVTWPGYAIFGNRVEPYVLGLPFSLAWNVLWVVMTCLVLATYYVTGRRES
jgi:hypothetical protein